MKTERLYTVFHLSTIVTATPQRIRDTLIFDGIEPKLELDGTQYFDSATADRLIEYFGKRAFPVGSKSPLIIGKPLGVAEILRRQQENRSGPSIQAKASDRGELRFLGGKIKLKAAASGKGPRQFSMVAYNGGMIRLAGWSLPVVVDLEGVQIAAAKIPVLRDHDEKQIVGHTESIDLASGKIVARGKVSGAGAAAKEVLASHDADFPWNVSIGAKPGKEETIRAGQTVSVNGKTFTGPLTVVRSARLHEISFVPIGADNTTTAAIAATAKGSSAMDDNENTPTKTKDKPAVREKKRIAAIDALAKKYSIGAQGPQIKAFADIREQTIDDGSDPDEAELQMLRAARPAGLYINTGTPADAPDAGKVIAASMCMGMKVGEKFLADQYGDRVVDAATSQQFRNMTLQGVFRHVLKATGRDASGNFRDSDFFADAVRASRELQASGFSTSSIPNVLSNVANKVALEQYSSVPTTWQLFAAPTNVPNFKPSVRFRLVLNGKMERVNNDGELRHQGLSDQAFAGPQLHTEGGIIAVTRQNIIDDDQSSLQDLPKIMARSSAIQLEQAVYATLMGAEGTFFTSGNGNLITGTSSALSTDSISAAKKRFKQLKDENGRPALINPSLMLVPSALEVTGQTLLHSQQLNNPASPKSYPVSNPHVDTLDFADSAWLDASIMTGNSETAWYLFGSPTNVPAVLVGFLNGKQVPTVESDEGDFSTLGIRLRCYFDFGVAMGDPRAAVKSTGVA